MRVAVIGAGAVGGYFGARLAAGGAGLAFVARGAHGAAMRSHGLRLLSPRGDLHLEPVRLLGEEARERFDAVLIAVKMYDLEAAARRAAALVASDGVVVPLQNGVEAVDILRRQLAARNVAGGVAYIAGAIEEPGVIRHSGQMARLVLGALDERQRPGLEALARACDAADVEAALVPDVMREIWKKFVFLAPFAGITCFARKPIGPVRDQPALWHRFEAMVREAVAVGRARGVELPDELVEERLAFVGGLPADMRSSMLTDLENGRRLELDWLVGAVVRLGVEAGVPVPASAEVYGMLEPLAGGVAP
ncbi:ketopantoate reductase family protein [Marinimicrococcus flavescens]|uniref:2-dehydropantoate 2-reductase n=1 Tax=Marinimicrococcus flavescens TaxID=3031815 RepID=A0AAP3XPQ5_9PROT|nr:2-dehydropantoate 2-reductase [Marinimicrococcus flavescens]